MKYVHRILLRVAYQLILVYWRIFKPTTGGAYVAIWCNDRVLIIRNSYKPLWTLPAGGQKKNETIEDAARREVLEEVAIRLEPNDLHLVGTFSSREEYKDDVVTLFESSFEHEPDFTIDNTEVVDAKFVSFDEAVRMIPQFHSIARQYFEWKIEQRAADDHTSASCSSAATSPMA